MAGIQATQRSVTINSAGVAAIIVTDPILATGEAILFAIVGALHDRVTWASGVPSGSDAKLLPNGASARLIPLTSGPYSVIAQGFTSGGAFEAKYELSFEVVDVAPNHYVGPLELPWSMPTFAVNQIQTPVPGRVAIYPDAEFGGAMVAMDSTRARRAFGLSNTGLAQLTTDVTRTAGGPATLLTQALTTAAGFVLVDFRATFGADAHAVASFKLTLDGVDVAHAVASADTPSGNPASCSFVARVPVTAGSHTFVVAWEAYTMGVTGVNVVINAASEADAFHAEMLLQEVAA